MTHYCALKMLQITSTINERVVTFRYGINILQNIREETKLDKSNINGGHVNIQNIVVM